MANTIIYTVAILILAAFVAVGLAIAWGAGQFSCWQKLKDSGHEYKYGLFSGCLVKEGKGFVPLANWRAVQ